MTRVVQELAERYVAYESLDAIAQGYALFVEFGWDPFALYQIRPFKPIAIAEFDLPALGHERPILRTDFPFGITPPEGIVLPVLRTLGWPEARALIYDWHGAQEEKRAREWDPGFKGSDDYSMEDYLGRTLEDLARSKNLSADTFRETVVGHNRAINHHLDGQPYVVMTTSACQEQYDVDLTVPRMQALISGRMQSFLVHGMMRLMKLADVTIPTRDLDLKLYNACHSIRSKVRIISNGREGVALLE